MKTALKHIATIQTGVFAKPIQKGEIIYLQSKHFDDNGEIIGTLYPDINMDSKINKHLLKKGDVLFAAKGRKNFAATWYDRNKTPAVASTSFFVIHLHDENVLPGYLTWFLNSPSTQIRLKTLATGTSIVSISKAVLSELEIIIPDTRKQQLILNIHELRKKEKTLQHRIEIMKEKEIQQQLINSINS